MRVALTGDRGRDERTATELHRRAFRATVRVVAAIAGTRLAVRR
jgi:hypothetical protein